MVWLIACPGGCTGNRNAVPRPVTDTPLQRPVILGVIPDESSWDSRVGVLISGTTPGTPADAAGLRGGDLLIQFGNQKLKNLTDLTQALASSKPGDKVVVKLIRGNQTRSFDITLAERKG